MTTSLSNSITIPKVNVGAANQLWSDRRYNPEESTCQMWGGTDLTGRAVCPGTFLTTDGGCNSALERIYVENALRPNYAEYQTLDTRGYTENLYDPQIGTAQIEGYTSNSRGQRIGTTQSEGSRIASRQRNAVAKNSPRFGLVSNQKIRPGGSVRDSDIAVRSSMNQNKAAALSEDSRRMQATVIGNTNQMMLANPSGDFSKWVNDGNRYMTIDKYNTIGPKRA
jgi:hypothetical protein